MKTMFKFGDLVTHAALHRRDSSTLGVVTRVTDIGLPKFAKLQILEVKWISGNYVATGQSYYDTSLELIVRGKNDEKL